MANRFHIIHMLATFCGVIICTCLMSSCGKEETKTSYMISFGWSELTQSRDIQDPEIREVYEQLLSDIYNLKSTTDAFWEVWIADNNYKTKDKDAENKFNSHLEDVKQIETRCKKVIDNLEIREGSSFFVVVEYTLKRWDVNENTDLQSYIFELRYN